MSRRLQRSPLTFQVTLTVMALAVFALAMVVGFGFYATVQADSASLERQKILFANGMRDRIAAVDREQESIAVWDDSVINAKAGNVAWMVDNISVWMYSYYGHDRVYVLDAADRPIHAMREGNVLAPASYREDEPALLPTVERVRRLIREPAQEDQAGGPVKLAAEDLVQLDGKPAILSIMPLVPSSDRVIQAPGSEYLHISVDFITDALLGQDRRAISVGGRPPAAVVAAGRRGCHSAGRLTRRHPGLCRLGSGAARQRAGARGRPGPDRWRAARGRCPGIPAAPPPPCVVGAADQSGRGAVSRLPRHAHRPAQPGAVRGPAPARFAHGQSRTQPRWHCSISTSTASSTSTTRSAILPATSLSARPPRGSSRQSGRSTRWRGSAATSSP